MIRGIRITTLGIFGLILLLPILQERLKIARYEPLAENRLKTPRPADWLTLFSEGTPFAKKYEEYFNDNYGFRDLLIRMKNQVDYSLFRKSDKVLIGPDRWLFYKSVVEQEEIYIEKARSQDWEKLFGRILRLNQALASRGITLVIVPCPMKNSIYPEWLPASAPRREQPTGLERYRRFLEEHPEILTVDTVPILQKLKESFQVFYRTDFHWTDPAGAYVARELVNRLGRRSGTGDLWDQRIDIQMAAQAAGGEGQFLGLLWPFAEQAPFLKPGGIRTGAGSYTRTGEANEWTYLAGPEDGNRLLPGTVMYGDSFGDAFERAGFAVYFSRFQKYFNWDFKSKYPGIPEGTRFVVLQHIEVFLNGLFSPALWPDEFISGVGRAN